MAAPLHVHQPEAADARSLSDRAYYRIRELIVSLTLPPGSILNERELMQELGLGRTPVREALRTLAREQLVEVYPRRGIFVSGVDVGDLAGLSEVRLALETAGARLAAERARPEDRERCAELLEELERAADGHDERALIELDQRIHRHVYALHAQPVSRARRSRSTTSSRCASGSSRSTASHGSRTPCASTASCSRRSGTATRIRPRTSCAATSTGFERAIRDVL